MMRCLALAAFALVVGCGKETPTAGPPVVSAPMGDRSAPAPPKAPAVEPSAPAPRPPSGDISPPVSPAAPRPASQPSTATVGDIPTAAVEAMITQKRKIAILEVQNWVKTYQAETGELPKSLAELTDHYKVTLKPIPPGTHWKYDRRTGDVDIVKNE